MNNFRETYRNFLKIALIVAIFISTTKCEVRENSSEPFISKSLRNFFRNLENDKHIYAEIDKINEILKTVDFSQEIKNLRKLKNGTYLNSRLPENWLKKNHYRNYLCYDHTRVILSAEGNQSDYIHANYVGGFKKKEEFILTQAPMNKTAPDFWRMIWEKRNLVIVSIVDIFNPKEHRPIATYLGKNEGEGVVYGDLLVITKNNEEKESFFEIIIELTNLKTFEIRKVVILKMKAWPDDGLPLSSQEILTLRKAVMERQQDMLRELGDSWTGNLWGPPIVVHCLAGFGRTGALVAIFTEMDRFDSTKRIDVFETTAEIRKARAYAIETKKHYELIFRCVREYIKGFLVMPRNAMWENLF